MVDSTAACWSAAQFKELMHHYPQIASNALAMVGERAEQMLQRVREVTTESADQRIAKTLIRLLEQQKNSSRDGELHISGQELAELSDTTLFTVSRAIATWKRDGILEGGRNRLQILAPARLKEIGKAE
jgi:CRP-like cAMP-binding protein